MRTHWYHTPILTVLVAIQWLGNLFKPKAKQKPVASASRWSDTVMAEAMDSTFGHQQKCIK